MGKREEQAEILKKYDDVVIKLYQHILREEKNTIKKSDLKKSVIDSILEEVKKNDN